MAEDRGTPPLSSIVDVVVEVVDSEAQPPFFEKSLYELNVKEDVGKSACLLQVKAKDRSCTSNDNRVRYSLRTISNEENETFRLDSESGKLCLRQELNFEAQSRYQLTVLAHSQGRRQHQHLRQLSE
ncbi:CaDHerin family [Aphelenchoides fujianensis]|nr:CaDHerin family [Aphelenchoides fujianensis]